MFRKLWSKMKKVGKNIWTKIKSIPAPDPKSMVGWLVTSTVPRMLAGIVGGLVGTMVALAIVG